MKRIIVVGGGAAGMFAAGVAASNGAKVTLFEPNDKLGKKLLITGKGRCNLTNDCDVSEVLSNIPNGSRFLYSAVNGFSPTETMAFFENLGVRLKTERGGRVFPQSDKAVDVVNALKRYINKHNVEIKYDRVVDLGVKNQEITGVYATSGEHYADAVILATGGKSYPLTGSTGDGYEMVKRVGHYVTELIGSLVPLNAESDVCSQMQGLALKNVLMKVYDGGRKPIFEDFGELLFTHFGISGPITLSASAHMRDFEKKKYYVTVDLKPGLSEAKLDERILRDFEKFANRDFINALGELLPRLMIPVIVEKSGINPELKVHSITRQQRRGLVELLKSYRIDIESKRPIEEAIITSGGVDLREINPKTMESKLIKGLYFAGEIIDADAYTGGFNLQIAWSTAYAAARAAGVHHPLP